MTENFYPAYKDCSECGKSSKNNEAYFKCKDSNCGYIEKQWVRASKEEKNIRDKVKKMINYLLKNKTPTNLVLSYISLNFLIFECD